MSDQQRMWIATVVLVMLIAASAAVAFGDQTTDEKIVRRDAASDTNGGGWVAWLQMIGALVIVVGLIFATRYALKRFGRLPALGAGGGTFKVLAAKNITARHQVVLVSMGRKLLVIGCGPEGMTRLGEVTDPDEIEELVQAAPAATKQAVQSKTGTDAQESAE